MSSLSSFNGTRALSHPRVPGESLLSVKFEILMKTYPKFWKDFGEGQKSTRFFIFMPPSCITK